ncbi:MAG: prolipoprotein diacylglyceryl transferase [Firmicutes bacterium]|nr:prolipoprotein diacylglyceryl transferase [Bacillota bacterium]
MDRIAIDFGIVKIYWYSICIFLGIITALTLIYRESKREKIDSEFLTNLAFYSVLLGILGARIYYVLFNIDYYIGNPLEILEVWNGGLAIHGGLLTGLIVTLIYCKKNKVNSLKMLDIIVVGVIVAQAIGRWGNFFNGEAFGNVTTLSNLKSQFIPEFIIDGMYIMGEYRQPTFLYESILCLIGFSVMIILRKNKNLKTGMLTGFYLIWYGLIRVIIESMRSDSLMLGPIKIAQLVSIIFIICGIIIEIKSKNNMLYKNK